MIIHCWTCSHVCKAFFMFYGTLPEWKTLWLTISAFVLQQHWQHIDSLQKELEWNLTSLVCCVENLEKRKQSWRLAGWALVLMKWNFILLHQRVDNLLQVAPSHLPENPCLVQPYVAELVQRWNLPLCGVWSATLKVRKWESRSTLAQSGSTCLEGSAFVDPNLGEAKL